MPTPPPTLSVVIPVFNESGLIGETVNEVRSVLANCTERFEIILVDDGSRDDTARILRSAHAEDDRVKGIRLSRNFGKEPALLAGLARSRGSAVVTMDADLQHPPSMIPLMLEKWREGAHVVHGTKRNRDHGGVLHRSLSKAYNALFTRMAGISIVNSSDFKLIDRRVVRQLVDGFPEHERFHRGLSRWVGFEQESVTFDVPERLQGDSRWKPTALFRYAWNTLTAYSSVPLQLVPLLGLLMLAVALALGTDAVVSKLLGNAVSGFATLQVTLLFTGSVIMIGLGVIGQYLARIYDEVKRRPVYIVAEDWGFGDTEDGGHG